MAYLHCHSCDWSQDDFWDFKIRWNKLHKWSSRPFGYNPLSLLLEDFSWLFKPRIIKFDTHFAEDNGFKSNDIHSWAILLLHIKRRFRSLFTQKWRTYKSWMKVKDTAVCPKCGERNFDID